jgi:MarR family transcriptional repressor of emrRAB
MPAICALLERQTAGLKPTETAQLERLLKKFLDQLERD